MKAIFKVTAVAALMAAGMSSAMAASGSGKAEVLIHGDVVPVACTMGPDADAPKDVALGSWTEADFTGTDTLVSTLKVVTASVKSFAITATGCTGVAPANGGKMLLRIDAQTPMISSADKLFGDSSLSKGTTAGFILEATDKATGATRAAYKAGDELVMHEFTSGETWASVNNSSINFDTYMAAKTATPGIGHVQAPVTFTVDYQ
jgi:type 1 fimbria pilin